MIRFATFFLASALAFASTTYSYDSAGRLIKVDYGNGATITYTYDNAGNLLTRTVTSGAASTSSAKQKKTKHTNASESHAPKQ